MNRIPGLPKKRSGEIARKRLKLLLAADKAGCSTEFLEMLKRDLCRVLSKYMEVDESAMEVKICNAALHGYPQPIPAVFTYIPMKDLTCHKGII